MCCERKYAYWFDNIYNFSSTLNNFLIYYVYAVISWLGADYRIFFMRIYSILIYTHRNYMNKYELGC